MLTIPFFLALTLLVAGVLADDEHLAMASDDLALIAHFLDRRTYLHNSIPFGKCVLFFITTPSRRR